MGAKAAKSKESILADTKNFLKILLPAIQRMPKVERAEGAAPEMKQAAFEIIKNFTTAYNCKEVRNEYIHRMFGGMSRFLIIRDLDYSTSPFNDL